MISLATAEPPGEFTRRTTALIESSRAAWSRALRILVERASDLAERATVGPPPSMIGPSTYTMPTAGLGRGLLLPLAHHLAPELEEGERRGEVERRLLLLAVLLVEDDVLAVLALEHRLEVLAVLDGVDQPGLLGLLGRVRAAVDPAAGRGPPRPSGPGRSGRSDAAYMPSRSQFCIASASGLGPLAQEDLGGALVGPAGGGTRA